VLCLCEHLSASTAQSCTTSSAQPCVRNSPVLINKLDSTALWRHCSCASPGNQHTLHCVMRVGARCKIANRMDIHPAHVCFNSVDPTHTLVLGTYIRRYICRVGLNHTHTVCVRYFWQGYHQIYGHTRCAYTVLANPIYLWSKCTGLGWPTPYM